MDRLYVLNFRNQNVRTILKETEIYWVGKDVCDVLGYKNHKDALNAHVEKEDKKIFQRSEIATLENNLLNDESNIGDVWRNIPNRGLIVINESGLYSLILSSKLPQAKEFKRWVTSEVLPAIRRTGKYQVPSDPMSALKLMFQAQENTNREVAKHDLRITELEQNKLLSPGEYNYIGRAIRNKVKQVKSELGFDLVQKQTSKIYHAINRDLNCFIGIKTRSQFKEKDFDKALEFIENWQLSYTDKKIIEQLALDI